MTETNRPSSALRQALLDMEAWADKIRAEAAKIVAESAQSDSPSSVWRIVAYCAGYDVAANKMLLLQRHALRFLHSEEKHFG